MKNLNFILLSALLFTYSVSSSASETVFYKNDINTVNAGQSLSVFIPQGTKISNNCDIIGDVYSSIVSYNYNPKISFYKAGDRINLKCKKLNPTSNYYEITLADNPNTFALPANNLTLDFNFANKIVNSIKNGYFKESEYFNIVYTEDSNESKNINISTKKVDLKYNITNNTTLKINRVTDYGNIISLNYTSGSDSDNFGLIKTHADYGFVLLDFKVYGNNIYLPKSKTGEYEINYAGLDGIDQTKQTIIKIEE